MGNIYLHQVLDLWFAQVVQPRLHGRAQLVRFADDYVLGFELEAEADARRVMAVLSKRMARFGLRLHPDKTRLIHFTPPRSGADPERSQTFNFLGFTFYWARTHRGAWVPRLKTQSARSSKALKAIAEYFRKTRHNSVRDQHAGLVRRLVGHYNYFAMQGNYASVARVRHHARRIWFKWLNRRSQRRSYTWQRYGDLLRELPIPKPKITVLLWDPV